MDQINETLKKYISKGKIAKSIELLLNNKESFPVDIEYQVITISSWYNRIKNEEISGIEVEHDQFQKICKSILEIGNQLKDVSNHTLDDNNVQIIFERKLTVKLLPIPFLKRKIERFKIDYFGKDSNEIRKLKLLIHYRKIDLNFECPLYLTVKHLKERIVDHFKLSHYIEYNSRLDVNLILTINNIVPYKEEETLLSNLDIYDGDFVGIKINMKIKNDDFGGFGGGIGIQDCIIH